MNEYVSVAAVVKMYRMSALLTQAQVAEAMGVRLRTYMRWESNDRSMPYTKWLDFLSAVGREREPYPGTLGWVGPIAPRAAIPTAEVDEYGYPVVQVEAPVTVDAVRTLIEEALGQRRTSRTPRSARSHTLPDVPVPAELTNSALAARVPEIVSSVLDERAAAGDKYAWAPSASTAALTAGYAVLSACVARIDELRTADRALVDSLRAELAALKNDPLGGLG